MSGKYRKRRVKLKAHDRGSDRHSKAVAYERKTRRTRETHHRNVSSSVKRETR